MMTQMTSVSNAWLARRLQMGVPGSVTQYVRRFRSHSDASQADRRRVLSTIHTCPRRILPCPRRILQAGFVDNSHMTPSDPPAVITCH